MLDPSACLLITPVKLSIGSDPHADYVRKCKITSSFARWRMGELDQIVTTVYGPYPSATSEGPEAK
jgi:hypothetical protein